MSSSNTYLLQGQGVNSFLIQATAFNASSSFPSFRNANPMLRLYGRIVPVVAVVSIVALSLVLGAGFVGAEPVGSPSSILERGEWSFGLSGGAVSDRDLDGAVGSTAFVISLEHFRGYGITDWLSVYGKIGGGRFKMEDNTGTHTFGGAFLIGGQVKLRLWQSKTSGWEIDGGGQVVHLRARHKGSNEGDITEWQLATNIAKSIWRLKPYAGVKLSFLDFNFKLRKGNAITREDSFGEDRFVGPFVGTDLYMGENRNVVVNVEASFIGGPSVDLAVQYTF